mgnify:CR=1 FL=1
MQVVVANRATRVQGQLVDDRGAPLHTTVVDATGLVTGQGSTAMGQPDGIASVVPYTGGRPGDPSAPPKVVNGRVQLLATLSAAEPLRVFIRANASNRGQETHAHPRFLGEWIKLLTERGMKVDGGLERPPSDRKSTRLNSSH